MTELCIRCGKETEYDVSTPVTARLYYAEGSGQLFVVCWKRLCPMGITKDKEKEHGK